MTRTIKFNVALVGEVRKQQQKKRLISDIDEVIVDLTLVEDET